MLDGFFRSSSNFHKIKKENKMKNTTINTKSLQQILEDTTEPPAPIIDGGVLLHKTLLLVYGQPKAKKTFLALNMAVAIAQGKSFAVFEIPKAEKVFYISAEGGYFSTRDRIKKMCHGLDKGHLPNFQMCFNSRINLLDEEDLATLKKKIAEYEPKVIIIDPLVRFHDADENSATKMGEVFTTIRGIIDTFNCSIILIHHAGKDDSRGARGSSAIAGEYDSCIQIDTNDDTSKLTFDMRHVETPEPEHIMFNKETLWFEEILHEEPVVSAIEACGGKATKNDLVKVLEQTFSKSGAYKAVDRALEKMMIKLDEGIFSKN